MMINILLFIVLISSGSFFFKFLTKRYKNQVKDIEKGRNSHLAEYNNDNNYGLKAGTCLLIFIISFVVIMGLNQELLKKYLY